MIIKRKLANELKKFMKGMGIKKGNIENILCNLDDKINTHTDETEYDKAGREIKKPKLGYGTSCFGLETNDKRRDIEF